VNRNYVCAAQNSVDAEYSGNEEVVVRLGYKIYGAGNRQDYILFKILSFFSKRKIIGCAHRPAFDRY